jgi:Holliday junction DNA helicase RuvB
LSSIGIGKAGLDVIDRKLLSVILESYSGGPVGLEALAATLNEEPDTIADTLEPYLLKAGFLRRTSRGRETTDLASQHLGLPASSKQKQLF